MKSFNQYITENTGKWVTWDSLPEAVQDDIVWNIQDKAKYTNKSDMENLDEWLYNENFYLYKSNQPVKKYYSQVIKNWGFSKLNLKNLETALKKYGELDPVLVDGNKFVDGGHRVFVYNKLKRQTIPTVDIGKLLHLNWDLFYQDKVNIPEK